MPSLSRARIVVVGAGVLGLASAAALARRGASVSVLDPALGQRSASAAAAGMIAPGLEAALENASHERAALYREAAALWPGFSKLYDLGLILDGADWVGEVGPMADRLRSLDVHFEEHGKGLYLPEEARLEVGPALRRLGGASALNDPIQLSATAVDSGPSGVVLHAGGEQVRADAVVVAAGWAAARLKIDGLAPFRHLVAPVKGQLIVLEAPGAVKRVTRSEGVYLVPTHGGVVAGATMEEGAWDIEATEIATEGLRRAAAAALPALRFAPVLRAWAGVRGASPDGLPLAGATAHPGVFAALAPRRNGWLLAPLVGEVVAAAVAGDAPPPHAAAFRPDRFGPA